MVSLANSPSLSRNCIEIEVFLVRQCQYCLKHLQLIFVQIENCKKFDEEITRVKMLKYVIMNFLYCMEIVKDSYVKRVHIVLAFP